MDIVKEKLELEEVDNLIDDKIDELNKYTEALQALVDKTNSFMNDYKDKVSSFTQTLNKEIEAIYNSIDSYEKYYINSNNELRNIEASLLDRESKFDGSDAKELEAILRSKLQSERDKLNNEIALIFDSILRDYKKQASQLDKASQRLAKLKNKEIITK